MEPNFKSYKLTLILIGIIILLSLAFAWEINSRNKATDHLKQEIALRSALQSEMVITKDKLGHETAEKVSLQTDVKTLVEMKDKLSADKQELITLVQAQDKNHKLIAAAVVKTVIVVKEITITKPVATTDSSASFAITTDSISYDAKVSGIHLDSTKVPSLVVRNLTLPNTSEVSFQWGDKQNGYPVSFKIKNSNPYFKVQNLDSYAIPELKKTTVRPNFFQAISLSFMKGKTPFIIGLSAGALGAFYFTHLR